ncbi:MAG: hypothetical protein HY757_00375 [Nitrospirae bacterium]|nr:hypothetical protein [Nitrospirota bacterium]
MVIASGFIEVNGSEDAEKVVNELKMRSIEVNEVNNEKVVFLIERETMARIKNDMELIKDINEVKNVYLAYYSIEGADEESIGPGI